MFDLPDNPDLQRLLTAFHAAGKIISAVCHGPCGLVNARRADGEPLVKGVTLTSYTASEEVAAKLDQEVPFILEQRLRDCGANFIARENRADHIERDGQFITGQNPMSSASIARAIAAALKKEFTPLANTVAATLRPASTFAEFRRSRSSKTSRWRQAARFSFPAWRREKSINSARVARHRVRLARTRRGSGLRSCGYLVASSSIGSTRPGIYRLGPARAELIVPLPDAVFLNGLMHLAGSRFLVADAYRGRFGKSTSRNRLASSGWSIRVSLTAPILFIRPRVSRRERTEDFRG